MKYFDKLYARGVEEVKNKKVVFCGMVRDCGSEVRHNIETIEQMGSFFADYRVVINENNSVDNTKEVLRKWASDNDKVVAICNDFDESKWRSIPIKDGFKSPNSIRRIAKYDEYRNIYLDYINNDLDFTPDYIVELDPDVARIDIRGFITSFGNDVKWDAVVANGYSYSPTLKRRHHDTYPLFEYGKDTLPDSLEKILSYREIFEPFRKGMPFFRIASGYGGIAIFKAEAIKGLRYYVIENNYGGIEALCDHVAIFRQMKERGFDQVFLNPNMEVYYQSISLKLIMKKLKDTFKK